MADERAELASIAASLRAYLELQWEAGSTGIPRGKRGTTAPTTATATTPTTATATATTTTTATTPTTATATTTATTRAAEAGAALPGAVRSLEVLEQEVRACTKCELCKTRTNTVFSRGDPKAALCFVGEAPGADEDAQGVPFVGRAGQLLDRMIAAMGLSPDGVYVCNILKCRPPGNRRPTPEETATCIPYLHDQLADVAPTVIVAMGNTAVQALLDTTMGITKVRGQWKLYRGKTLVMPTYHPSYLLREGPAQRTAKQEAWEDLQKVMKELALAPPKKA